MFAASHIASGSLVHDALKDEKKLWFKVPLAIGGLFVFHWILDLTPCFHDMNWPWNGFQWFIFWFNIAFVALIWWASRRAKYWWLPPNRLLWGVFGGWLMWDIFWLFDPGGGPHRLCQIWDRIPKWGDPQSFLLEALFIALVVLISLPAIKEWWKSENSRPFHFISHR